MGLGDRLKRLFGREPKMEDQLPEVLGQVTDQHGQKRVVHRGPLQHESLTPDQLQRVGRLRDVLIDAYPMTLDGWVDGFMRDLNPESEIQIIEACAVVYQCLTKPAHLSADEKKRVYAVLCAVSTGADGPQLAAALPAGKGLPPLDNIVRMYREARSGRSHP